MTLQTPRSDGELIAQSVIPYNRDDSRARYLGLRACGFAIREALKLVGRAHSSLSMWRTDPVFADLENRIPEFKEELAREYASLDFLRNFRLVMEKDYQVLSKATRKDKDGNAIELSSQEQAYLLKLRSNYTPQQLQVLESLVQAEREGLQAFNFTQFVIEAQKLSARVEIESRKVTIKGNGEGDIVELQPLQPANDDSQEDSAENGV